MNGRMIPLLLITILAGCSQHRSNRSGVFSQELPLTVNDISEIRAGEQNHKRVLEEYWVYENPKLVLYVNSVAARIAEVSIRPNLPYKAVILDSEEVNCFGGPGGYIYLTKGLFDFIESESELAGIIAHEVSHIASHGYADIPSQSKVEKVYKVLLAGSELAKEGIGSYGTAANRGLKAIGQNAPKIKKHFDPDQEMVADEFTIKYLIKSGYDPEGYKNFMERLSKVPISDVNRFVNFMNVHPPFPDRHRLMEEQLAGKDYSKSEIEMKVATIDEIRQLTIPPEPPQVPAVQETKLFAPQFGASVERDPETVARPKENTKAELKKVRNAWF